MYTLTDERVDFKVLEPVHHESLLDKILNAGSDEERVDLIEGYITDVLKTNQYANDHIRIAANSIYEEQGQTDLNALIEKMPMSRRTFERKFLHEVGVSPKMYAKIRRFGYTCTLMAGKREINTMDVLHQGGYYDQSHFIKDFKYFSNRTPRTYVQGNTELDNYLDSITIVEQRLQSGT